MKELQFLKIYDNLILKNEIKRKEKFNYENRC